MKIIYLILTFSIIYINAYERLKEPRIVDSSGSCIKRTCVVACNNDPDAFCKERVRHNLFWHITKCGCFRPL
uniref:Venom protein n=1 Tax=Strongyloides venezuelensis TaxID=75913 RepID=A0A0K0FVP4_STRVS